MGQKLETKGFNHIHAVSSYHNIMLAHILVDTSAKIFCRLYIYVLPPSFLGAAAGAWLMIMKTCPRHLHRPAHSTKQLKTRNLAQFGVTVTIN